MMIYSNAICDDRTLLVDEFDEGIFFWGTGVVCCRQCLAIVESRNAWKEMMYA